MQSSKIAHLKTCEIIETLEDEHIRIQDEVWFRVFDIIEAHVQEAIDTERERWTAPSEN